MELTDVTFEVFRIEAKDDPDSVDFWDFPDEKEALHYMHEYLVHDYPLTDLSIRRLSNDEIVHAALQVYKDIINLPGDERDDHDA
jgi:hypothetical protein